MEKPPPIASPKSLRVATLLNLMLPGAGQFYFGQRRQGCILAGLFLLCFVGGLGLFLIGFAEYFKVTTGGKILEGDNLEQLGDVFHVRWLVGFMAGGVLVYAWSVIGLYVDRRSAMKE